MTSVQLARRLAALVTGKGATDPVALGVRELVSYTDFLVICTARNERLVRAIQDEVVAGLKAEGVRPAHVEGELASGWIVTDYLDCVLHVFTPEAREHYRLEQLWGEAPRLELDPEATPVRANSR